MPQAARSIATSSPDDTNQAALAMLHTGQGDAMAAANALVRDHPAFAPGHCLRLALLVMAAREDALADLAGAMRAARALRHADAHARRHFDAAAAWLARDLRGALDAYGAIAADHPLDSLALRVAHFGDGKSARGRGPMPRPWSTHRPCSGGCSCAAWIRRAGGRRSPTPGPRDRSTA